MGKYQEYLKAVGRHPSRTAQAAWAEITRIPKKVSFDLEGIGEVNGILPDSVTRYMYLLGDSKVYEPETAMAIDRLVEPGSCGLVIGAQIGIHALMAKEKTGPVGWVVAFEPTPETYEVLKQNCLPRNIQTDPRAIVGPGVSSVEMTIFDTRHSAWNSAAMPRVRKDQSDKWHPKKIEVPAVSIDNYCFDRGIRPDWLILDLENGERAALEGAGFTVKDYRPIITIECGDLGRSEENNTRTCLEWLEDRGYRFFDADPQSGRFLKHRIASSYPDEYPNVLAVHRNKLWMLD